MVLLLLFSQLSDIIQKVDATILSHTKSSHNIRKHKVIVEGFMDDTWAFAFITVFLHVSWGIWVEFYLVPDTNFPTEPLIC